MTELPSTNIKRNFPGVSQEQYYSIEDIVAGDTGGTTESDSKTDPDYEGEAGYSKINKGSYEKY